MDKRRQHSRLNKPLDATWLGQSGASRCRISDISWTGCFIETLALPMLGEETTVTIPVRGTTIRLRCRVRHLDKTMGFGVSFDSLNANQIDALTDLLGEPPASLLT